MRTLLAILVFYLLVAITAKAAQVPLPLVSAKQQVFASGDSLNTNLIAYWKLDEASGTRVDSEPTGTAQNLTDNFTVNQTNGIISNSAWFIAANTESLSRADSSDLSVSGSSFTIAGWIYVDSLAAQRDIASKYAASGNREYLLRVQTSGAFDMVLSTNGSTVITVTTNSAITANTWAFVAAGVDTATLRAFVSVNGGGKIETSVAASAIDTGAAFYLGYRDTSGSYHSGYLDEWGFWKKALSDSELTRLYGSGAGKTCCPY